MALGRRGFLNSLFISPAVAQARKEQIEQDQAQKLDDERVAQIIKAQQLGVSPQDLKPRCGVCDAVLINGKCQHTVKCRYCDRRRDVKPGKIKANNVPICPKCLIPMIVERAKR